MITTLPIPVTITPDAAERIDELGMHRECEAMVEKMKQLIPDLQAVKVESYILYDEPEEPPHIALRFWRPESAVDDSHGPDAWDDWYLTTFPPEVCWWFTVEANFGNNYEG